MKKLEEDFLKLLKLSVTKETGEKNDIFEGTDWNAMLQLCNRNGLAAVAYQGLTDHCGIDLSIKNKWEMLQFQIYIKERKHFYCLINVLDSFTKAGIPYALFKGVVLAQLYSDLSYRESSDSDILIQKKDQEKAEGILLNHGYVLIPEKTKENVPVYYNEDTGHTIELHEDLFEDYSGVKINQLKAMELDIREHCIEIEIEGKKIWTLGYEEHLIYLFFHFIKHFILEGAGIRGFIDIALYVDRYHEWISKESFWEKIKELHYDRFCSIAFQICHDYFGMNAAMLDGHRVSINPRELDDLLVDLIHCGDLSDGDRLQWKLVYHMKPYLQGEGTLAGENQVMRKIQFLFPSQESIHPDYAYAKKYKWLLPVAWIHRAIRSARKQVKPEQGEYSSLEKMSAVEKRLTLISSVGLDR